MKHYSRLISSVSSIPLLVFSIQVNAEPASATGFVNSILEAGQCGQGQAGKIQYLQNSDENSAYEVTVKSIAMREGQKKETSKSISIKAGGKKNLGCTLSEIMPLASYERIIVSETKSP